MVDGSVDTGYYFKVENLIRQPKHNTNLSHSLCIYFVHTHHSEFVIHFALSGMFIKIGYEMVAMYFCTTYN